MLTSFESTPPTPGAPHRFDNSHADLWSNYGVGIGQALGLDIPGTTSGQRYMLDAYGKVHDGKVARESPFDGPNGDTWLKTTRMYLRKAPEAAKLLAIVERKSDATISETAVQGIRVEPGMKASCDVLNGHTCNYLTFQLTGNAKTILHNVEPGVGSRNGT